MSVLLESVIAAASILPEMSIDFETTALIATEAFATQGKVFDAQHMRWLYNDCFSHGTSVVGAYVEGKKVGQIALIHQVIDVEGRAENAVLLADLFILKKYRSKAILTDLFTQVEAVCAEKNVRYVLGMPNRLAQPINVHFLKMAPVLKLDIRAGISLFGAPSGGFRSVDACTIGEDAAIELFGRYALSTENALHWTPEQLLSRLSGREHEYGIHWSDRLLAISSPRVTRGIAYTLLCGFFPAKGVTPTPSDIRMATRRASRHHHRLLYIYAGHDEVMPALPGIRLPDRFRPSPMTLDLRDLAAGATPHLRRYQLTDFDFA